MLVKPLVRPICRAIAGRPTASLGAGFAPTSLFADGSIGVLYDNNDLTSFYLDAAGTTAATVNGLVGLQLDKSQGLVLGAELVTNGDFSNGSTGWFVRPLWAVSGGSATATGSSDSFQQVATPYTAGKWYRVEFDWTHTGGTLFVRLGTGPAATFTTSGRKVVYLLAVNTAGIEFYGGAASGTLDNISVKELPGNHRYQTTTGSKPVLRGTPTGSNLVTNGDFASGTAGWSALNATLSASGGGGIRITNTAGGQSSAGRSFATTIGKVYRVTGTLTTQGTGTTCWLYLGTGLGAGDIGGIQWPPATTGTKVFYFTATTTTTWINPSCGTPALAGEYHEWDNIEVKDVSAGSVTAPYGLQYDGVDDFLQTASVNFSATDKMFVCAGVRKLSDAAAGILAELSVNTNLNNGAFFIAAPNAANTFYFASNGTAVNAVTRSSFVSPISAVLTMASNISGPTLDTRVNASASTTSTSTQGTGNFGNYPIYFGRRGGASIPYNGLDFGFVIVGKTLTAAQIASTERWMAQRTGVSI